VTASNPHGFRCDTLRILESIKDPRERARAEAKVLANRNQYERKKRALESE
jgi:hypothetical protein